MVQLRYQFATFAVAASGLTISAPAFAAHQLIYGPRVEASTASAAHQGPHVAGSSTTIVNGVVTDTRTGPGGGTGGTGDAVHVTSSSFQNGGTNGGEPLHNSTFASADLTTGIFKASTASTGPNNFGTPSGFASGSMQDTLYFTNTSTSALVATLTFAFDGTMSDPFGGNPGGQLGLSVSCLFFNCYNAAGTPIQFATGPTRVADGAMNHYFSFNRSYFGENIFGGQGSAPYFETHLNSPGAGGSVDGYIRTSILVPTGETSLGLRSFLSLDCRGASSCDFGHTGTLSFSPLPDGLSFTSASGAFLSALQGGVPEPATWAMMILGFGLTGTALRRKRRGRVAMA